RHVRSASSSVLSWAHVSSRRATRCDGCRARPPWSSAWSRSRSGDPMIKLRPVRTLFHAEGGWFSANWHFSFDQYWDPEYAGFGTLRVLNDDRLAPGAVW